ncbi:MAG: transglycosylase SLT domain-containing protein [Dehalococcoidia bacterium]|nr:transglycosylase SLT domain-containing protein [Dehalococcoidia bacterium]
MSRLAAWADYGVAVAFALCRRVRVPVRQRAALLQPAYEPVYAWEGLPPLAGRYAGGPLAVAAPVGLHWHEPPPSAGRQPWFVRPAEVAMLTLSFFLAAHLVGGGTPEARAPQASAALVPSISISRPVPARVVEVRPTVSATAGEAAGAAAAVPAEDPKPAPVPATADAAASGAAPERPGAGAPEAPSPAAAAPAERPMPAAAPPSPAPSVAPPAASQPPLTYAQVIAFAIEAGWPAELADSVARVAWCESRFRPDAVGYMAYGLMQVIPLWFEYAGIPFERWSDPVANLKAALAAFRYSEAQGHSQWAAWTCKPEAITIP